MKHDLPDGFRKDVVGYSDRISLRPGESVGFKLSAWQPGKARCDVVHLISGDDRPHGTGLIERPVADDLNGGVQVDFQPLLPGSQAHVPGLPAVAQGQFEVWFYPTLLGDKRQTLAHGGGVTVSVNRQGVYALWAQDDLLLEAPLQTLRWYRLVLTFGAEVTLRLDRRAGGLAETDARWHAQRATPLSLSAGDWRLAARAPGEQCFNGRLEAPCLRSDQGVVAAWDFCRDMQTQTIVDVSGHDHHGALHQTPTRAVRGIRWDGAVQSYHLAPEQYGAIHFHADDLTDAGWSDSLRWTVPDDLTSGQYALKVTLGDSEDYVPFFVRPPAGRRGADLVYLVPTASYLAYANERLGFVGGIFGEPKIRYANDAFLFAHRDVGYSMYEYHDDHSGVHFSSRLRPVLNMKPRNGTWAFNADTHLTAWLDAIGQPFDVLTDEDLHLEGAAALTGYRTVLTGTHPEYYSTEMRDALSAWLGEGGRLMYMGGNGFYWRVAFDPHNPAIMEVRRAEDGTRAWIAEPGEYYHQFNGEYGGLWRRLGRPPNELVGVGFAAQGFDGGTHYRVLPGADDPRVAFAVAGITERHVWGNFGNQGGGAAGEEIDRFDLALGSPAHAIVLASSERHRPGMLRVKEEFHMTEPLGDDPEVRADIVFFEVPGGGAVFSTGSISYAGSLAHEGYDNHIARLTGNVLARFLDPEPFDYPDVAESGPG